MADNNLPQADDRLLLRGQVVKVERATPTGNGADLLVQTPDGDYEPITATWAEIESGRRAMAERNTDPRRLLAALYGYWMQHASEDMRSGALATKPLEPFAHQDEAVDRMLAQPVLRFMLADEPGTGKTIMSGLYIVEARRKMLIQGKVLVVAPAHLVPKWERELRTHFGIKPGIVTAEVGRELRPLREDVDTWLVSLDLFTHNPDVRSKLAGPTASWSLALFDEAHRLTPTSQYLGAAHELSGSTRHLLMLTATPHRGKEEFFRELMHLLDPETYPLESERPCIPSSTNFIRRMKEDLKDADNNRLFPERFSYTRPVSARTDEETLYADLMDYVNGFYPDDAVTIARIIYGKRAASSAHAVRATLMRRREAVKAARADRGTNTIDRRFMAALQGDLSEAGLLEDDERWGDAEDAVVTSETRDRQGELETIDALIDQATRVIDGGPPGKWDELLTWARKHDVRPGNDQLLVFTEFTDTAGWLLEQFRNEGFTARVLHGGLGHDARDVLQQGFLEGDYQVLVSTDAGGEGINLQSANVMFNWDIPWSMVRLEQRMGRLHRIGQDRDVFVYHLVTPSTTEGRVQQVMLDNISEARDALSGRMYDLMDATASKLGFDFASLLARAQAGTADASDVPDAQAWKNAAEDVSNADDRLRQQTDLEMAQRRLIDDELEQINPVHVRRFLEAIADWQDWAIRPGPENGIHIVDAGPGAALPDVLGGSREQLVATHGEPVTDAIRRGAVGLADVIVFGPTEDAFLKLADLAIDAALPDLAGNSPITLVDTESYTPYVLGVYETTVTAETDAGRVSRKTPFLVRPIGAGDAAVPDWTSVLRLASEEPGESPGALTPGVRTTLADEATAHVERLQSERRASRRDWVADTKRAMDDAYHKFRMEIQDREDDERTRLLSRYNDRLQARRAELDRMLDVDATRPTMVGYVTVAPGLVVGDPETRENSEIVAIEVVMADLERQGFADIADVQTAGVGYDLRATNHSRYAHRCVEVKGCLHGLHEVTLEQSEWTQAQQLGDAYWLYVVTHCQDQPRITIRIQNPAATLAGPREHQRFTIPTSELRKHELGQQP